MARALHLLDRWIDFLVVAALVFTPLAFGAVEEWARATGQITIWVLFAAWLCKLLWTPHNPSRVVGGRRFGGRVRFSGLELPALAFVAVLLLQLVPLPPALIGTISPKTNEIFEASLPGYGRPDPTFSGMPAWLAREPASPDEIRGFPADPESASSAFPAEWFGVEHRPWRPLSLTPADTKRTLMVFLAHLALFVVVYNQIDRRHGPRGYVTVVALLAGVLAVIGVLQSLTADGKIYWWRTGGPHHGFGPFVSANNFSGWMEMALPLAAALALAGVFSRRASSARALLFGFTTVFGLAALVLALSRGGFLSTFGALGLVLLFYLIRGRLSWRAAALILVPVIVVIGLVVWIDLPAVADRYGTLADFSEDRSFESRVDFSSRALSIARDFPLLGSGLGTFREVHYLYTPGTASRELARAHNDYAQLAAEGGVLGTATMLWALGILLWRGVRPVLLRSPRKSGWIAPAAVVGVLALLLHSFADFNLQIYSNSLLFVLLMAIVMHEARRAEEGRP